MKQRSLEFNSWYGMNHRCSNPKSPSWARYGVGGVIRQFFSGYGS